jgi:hypothetical protein
MLEKDAMNILMKFLDKKVREAEDEVTQRGTLSDDKAIPLILKTQFNHIAHLEADIGGLRETMDRRFEQVDKRFEQVDARFSRLERNLFGGFAFLGFLITFYRFVH